MDDPISRSSGDCPVNAEVARRWSRTLAVVLALVCTSAPAYADLPPGTDVDYQLGGNRSVPEQRRHRRAGTASPLRSRAAYNVCYVNGFQTQPNERPFWRRHWKPGAPETTVHPVVDGAWGEWLLDTRTNASRRQLARIVGRWVEGCAAARLRRRGVRQPRLVHAQPPPARARAQPRVRRAPGPWPRTTPGSTSRQKNLAGYDGTTHRLRLRDRRGVQAATTSATRYTDDYGNQVIAIEYRGQDFRWTCSNVGDLLPVVLRDRDLTPTGVRRWC